jgi:Transglycosylase SLT domain
MGINPALLDAIRQVESGGNRFAVSPVGAKGPYQFMPSTAKEFGLMGNDVFDENKARDAATRKMNGLLKEYGGNLEHAIAAYNLGQGNMKKLNNDYTRVPETRDYVKKVLSAMNPISEANASEVPYTQSRAPLTPEKKQELYEQYLSEKNANNQPSREELYQQYLAEKSQQNTQAKPQDESKWSILGSTDNLETAGQRFKDIGMGALQGAANIGTTLMRPFDSDQETAARKQKLSDFFKENSNPNSVEFKGGNLASEVAGTAPLGGIIGKAVSPVLPGLGQAISRGGFANIPKTLGELAKNVAGGAISGGATTSLVNPEDAAIGAMIGGALPGLTQAASPLMNKLGNALSPEVKALARQAQNAGIDIPADKLLNSRPLNAIASSLNYVPLSGRQATEEKLLNQLNSALSRTMGENTPNINQALQSAKGNLGNKFDSALSHSAVQIDNTMLDKLSELSMNARNELLPEQYKLVNKQIDSLLSAAQGDAIPGKMAYNIKKTFDRMQKTGDSSIKHYAGELKSALLDAYERTNPGSNLKQLRGQYSNYAKLSRLAKNGAEGSITPASIANLKGAKSKDLQTLSDMAAQFLRTQESPHGAAQRIMLGGLGAAASPFGLAAPFAGAVAGGRALNSALNSKTLRELMINGYQPTEGLVNQLLKNKSIRSGLLNSLANNE